MFLQFLRTGTYPGTQIGIGTHVFITLLAISKVLKDECKKRIKFYSLRKLRTSGNKLPHR